MASSLTVPNHHTTSRRGSDAIFMSGGLGMSVPDFVSGLRADRDSQRDTYISTHNTHLAIRPRPLATAFSAVPSARDQLKSHAKRVLRTASRAFKVSKRSTIMQSTNYDNDFISSSDYYEFRPHFGRHTSTRSRRSMESRRRNGGRFSPTLAQRMSSVGVAVGADNESILGFGAGTPEIQRKTASGKRYTVHQAQGPESEPSPFRRSARYSHPVVSGVVSRPSTATTAASLPSVSESEESWEGGDDVRFSHSTTGGTPGSETSSLDLHPGVLPGSAIADKLKAAYLKVESEESKRLSRGEFADKLDGFGMESMPRPIKKARMETIRGSQTLPYIPASGPLFESGTLRRDFDADSKTGSEILRNRDAALAALENPVDAAESSSDDQSAEQRHATLAVLETPADAAGDSKLHPVSIYPGKSTMQRARTRGRAATTGGLYLGYLNSEPFNPFNEPLPPRSLVVAWTTDVTTRRSSTSDFADSDSAHRRHRSLVVTQTCLFDATPETSRSATPDFALSGNERRKSHYGQVESGVWDELYDTSRPVTPEFAETGTKTHKLHYDRVESGDWSPSPDLSTRSETPDFDETDADTHKGHCTRVESGVFDDRDMLPSRLQSRPANPTPPARFSKMSFFDKNAPMSGGAPIPPPNPPSPPQTQTQRKPAAKLIKRKPLPSASAAGNGQPGESEPTLPPPQVEQDLPGLPVATLPLRPAASRPVLVAQPRPTHGASNRPAPRAPRAPAGPSRPATARPTSFVPPIPMNDNGMPMLPRNSGTQWSQAPQYQRPIQNWLQEKMDRDIARKEASKSKSKTTLPAAGPSASAGAAALTNAHGQMQPPPQPQPPAKTKTKPETAKKGTWSKFKKGVQKCGDAMFGQ